MDKPLAMWNCWFQKLISEKYEFSPSCNPDGGFQTKQCFLSRYVCRNKPEPTDSMRLAGECLKSCL